MEIHVAKRSVYFRRTHVIYVNSIKMEADLSDLSDSWRSIIFALNFR